MKKPGRNEPCHCGSGKKYKQCCQQTDQASTAGSANAANQGTTSAINKLMYQAMDHHNAGRLLEAHDLYQQVLKVAPGNADALHLLGVIAFQSRMNDTALELIGVAISIRPSASMHYNLGNAQMVANQVEAAIASFRQALCMNPNDANAHFNLGNAHCQQGALEEAVASYRAAIACQPGYADAHRNLGNALKAQGKLEQAISAYRQALAIKPEYAEAHANLGAALLAHGEPDAALACYRQAIAQKPEYAEAHNNLGVALKRQGDLAQAGQCYRRAIALDPEYAEALNNLGNLLLEQGDLPGAERHIGQALACKPGLPEIQLGLGNLQRKQGQLDAALASYERALLLDANSVVAHCNRGALLQQLGRFDDALDSCRQALALDPHCANAHYNLGNVFKDLGQADSALRHYQSALALDPNDADVHNNLGNVYYEQGKLLEAFDSYQQAARLNPGNPLTHSNLGNVHKDRGQPQAALQSYRKALELQADYAEGRSNLLFLLCSFPGSSPAEYFAEAQQYGEIITGKATPYANWGNADPRQQRLPMALRVGMVSGDFRSHPVGFFLESLLGQLDPARIELHAYATQPQEDALTRRIKANFAQWHSLVGLSDQAAAEKIHGDQIDILIDLAGHTAHNRLPVFAWKPAPLQVGWLGYFASTGLPAIDYLITDPHAAPPGQGEQFSERLWPLPHTRLCFSAPTASSELLATALPALENGHITFGCFQNSLKINDAVLALWGRIFAALPTARLHLQSRQMDCASVRDNLLLRLDAVGIAPERVHVEGVMQRRAYLVCHAKIDMVLDTFPYPGGTTTCEALWMGVPTLTLAGDTMLARQGAGLLACAGLEDWIADNQEEYFAKALAFAADVDGLARLRLGLRERVLASPLFDAARFAGDLQNALERMWGKRRA